MVNYKKYQFKPPFQETRKSNLLLYFDPLPQLPWVYTIREKKQGKKKKTFHGIPLDCRKWCLSASINTWISSRSLNWPRHKQLCSRPAALSGSLRYDVTTTNLPCIIMNKFPVCIFTPRVVDPVKLLIINNLC